MSENKDSTIARPGLSSEQALDDYFTALLGDESFETEEFLVDESDDESGGESGDSK